MKYIENDGHITREYEVSINTEELKNIIRELDEKCYRVLNKKIKIAANSKEEAIKKANMAINRAGIKINGLIEISDGYNNLVDYPGSLLVFDCDCLCKQSSSLVYILERMLDNYNSSLDFKKDNNRLIDLLIQFKNSDELKPYEQRKEECYQKIKDFLSLNTNDEIRQYNLQEESNALILEMRHNKNFDFELLSKLYQKAKECFELTLVSETVHYKDFNHYPMVYKLGEKKSI